MPSGPVKHRKPKSANSETNRNVTIGASFRPRFNHTHCSRPCLGRHVWCYPSCVKPPFRTPKLIQHTASLSRAISFALEKLDPLLRHAKFQSFERSLPPIVR